MPRITNKAPLADRARLYDRVGESAMRSKDYKGAIQMMHRAEVLRKPRDTHAIAVKAAATRKANSMGAAVGHLNTMHKPK